MRKIIRIHILGGMPKGNIGTIAAQRSLCKLLKDMGNIEVSISTDNRKVFKLYHPEFRDEEIYEPLYSALSSTVARNYIQWVMFRFLDIILFTFTVLLTRIRVLTHSKIKTTNRMKQCDILVDLNLEQVRGIPISVSPALIKRSPLVLVIHKLFWSFRTLSYLWIILIIKSIFKKKIVIGPASFGPFKGLPLLTRLLIKFVLSRFVDLLLVREPYSAKFLDELNVKNYIVVSDVALLEKAKTSLNHNDSPKLSEFVIGVAPAMLRYTLTKEEFDSYVLAHAKCLDDLVQRYNATILFLPSTHEDTFVCEVIRNQMIYKNKTKIIITNNVDEYETWIERLDILIATRMHPSIIAARNFIPFCSIIYDHKQIGFLSQIKLKECSLLINNVSYDTLKFVLDYIIQHRFEINKTLKDVIPKLQDALTIKLYSIFNVLSKYKVDEVNKASTSFHI